MTDPVLTARDGAVLTITLNRPEKRNPISPRDMIDALEAALFAANDDETVNAVILTGAGKGFSSGGDIDEMSKSGGMIDMSPLDLRKDYRTGIQRLPRAFAALDVPVIAAVNGPAMGAGADLACLCDIRIAGRSARFASSFVKLGIIPGDGGALHLLRMIGYTRAAQMILTGAPIDADTALAWGLVAEVVEDAELMPAAHRMAGAIAANPGYATRMAKRLLREAERSGGETILELSAAFQAIASKQPEHLAALQAFIGGRGTR